MDDIVHLGDTSQCPSTQLHPETDCNFGRDFLDDQTFATHPQPQDSAGVEASGRTLSARSSSCPSQSQGATPHKVRGPNWTEAEMLVLIGQKRIEWDGRHNCNQPSLARFVYGTTAWK